MADDETCLCGAVNNSFDALQYVAESGEMSVGKVEIPAMGCETVKIRVAYVGLCGQDVSIIDGKFPCADTIVIGHEISGVVEEVGSEVKKLNVGDKVVVDPSSSCMVCNACRTGRAHLCPEGGLRGYLGIFKNGGATDFCVVNEAQVYKLPESVTLEQAVFVEPLSCALHAIDLSGTENPAAKILILGAGMAGLLVTIALNEMGYKGVVISEPMRERRMILQRLELGYDVVEPQYLDELHEENPDYVFDIIIDASGNTEAIEQAFALATCGGTICIFGCAPEGQPVSFMPFDVFVKELKIVGSLINPHTFPKAVKLVESMGCKYLDFTKLGVKVFELADYQNAINELKVGAISKAVFKFDLDAK